MNKFEIKGRIGEIPSFIIEKCTFCKKCLEICPTRAISTIGEASCARCIKYCINMVVPCNPDHYIFSYEQCDSCGLCVFECPFGAIEWVKKNSVDQNDSSNLI
ncbi:MAG: 4Fe-4S binding protein [Bacteroidales bacterium]|nr:4Fe-4S binding protein [Bacteroidales bacterium]